MHPFEDLIVPDDGVGIHWFGQSTFALKNAAGTIVQVDPYYPRERQPDRFIHSRAPLMEESLRTDFILLTHNHGDHTCPESIERILAAYPQVRCVAPRESASTLRECGVDAAAIATVEAGGQAAMGSMSAHVVYAKPPEGDPGNQIAPPDVQHLGYVVDTGAVRVYFSGDPINTFAEHESLLEPIRALKPDIGFLTNHPDEGEFPFFAGSAKTAAALGLKAAGPAHYGCFVTRDYDPEVWAAEVSAAGTQPLVIPYNQSVVYRGA
jgi:L-ascorbate metabolism protein UlaG (beta-lactamase superfamily)